eukprot:9183124-Pyramimonas_sp.AAC.1
MHEVDACIFGADLGGGKWDGCLHGLDVRLDGQPRRVDDLGPGGKVPPRCSPPSRREVRRQRPFPQLLHDGRP